MNPLLMALVNAGILSQADAERIDRQLDPQAARLYAENLLTDSFRRGLTAQQRRILELVDGTDGEPTAAQLNRLWANEDELLWASVGDDILSVAGERAVVASIGAGPDTWRLVNESVIGWAETYYINPDVDFVGSIPNLNVTTRTAFQRAFVEWQRGELGISGRTATGELRQGLDALIVALEPIFGVRRARAIGITETSRVFAESERQAARANEFVVYLQWLTGNDELVCPICGPRANMVVGKESDGFRVATDSTVGFPPAHPNCRCAITSLTQPAIESLREQGLVNG